MMSTAELKIRLFRQIDSLEKSKLEGLYGVFINYINEKNNLTDWSKLPEEQKQGILQALDELEAEKGISHNKVMTKYMKKYKHD